MLSFLPFARAKFRPLFDLKEEGTLVLLITWKSIHIEGFKILVNETKPKARGIEYWS